MFPLSCLLPFVDSLGKPIPIYDENRAVTYIKSAISTSWSPRHTV